MSNPAVDRLRLALEMADAGIVLVRQNLSGDASIIPRARG